ncbi:Crp/Fnr family transcriptional regulator [Robertkochia solimangrovi]|uniref:Crp/Fnr family transcriptional regulator n=1 Tax=Robertkochia solimangrovi TaxID=2213046 RepID=UPI00117E2902|nr:Crp/Fnr family transcriptional regulator [Robertkochia solimangrovi]TRZ45992.1 Crp/Fnr family transcriptional regulator [Robertkochia solimangrovi]
MFSEYFNILGSISPIGELCRKKIESHLTIKEFKKGEHILHTGETCNHIYFMYKGCNRIYYYKNDKEITEWFTSEKHFCFSITSFFDKTPSHLSIETLEDSVVIQLSRKGIDELIHSDLEFANLFINILSGSLKLSQKRMDSMQFETARQRYQNLVTEQPEILQFANLQHIASFLGITSETLSRIRS